MVPRKGYPPTDQAAALARICLRLTCASAPRRSAYRSRRATLRVESLPRVEFAHPRLLREKWGNRPGNPLT